MKNIYLSQFIFILLMCFFNNTINAQNELTITSSMITPEGDSNPDALFDGDSTTFWFAGWSTDNYPAYAYIDFGAMVQLSQIDFFDFSGEGGFRVFTGSPGNWNSPAIVSDMLQNYAVWKSESVDVTTQYLRLEITTFISRVGEMKIYGEAVTNSPPIISEINDITIEVGTTETIDVSALYTTELSADGAPTFAGFSDNGNGSGTFEVTPTSNDVGTYTITVSANGPNGTSSTSFTITVTDPGGGSSGGNTEVLCEVELVSLFSGAGDPSLLFDEQAISGDPRTGPGGNPMTNWYPGWTTGAYPGIAYADLGQVRNLTRIFIRDINGDGNFKIYTGISPTSYNPTPIIDDELGGYFVWNEHAVEVSTRYLFFELPDQNSNVAEVLIYGLCGGGPPVDDNTAPADVTNLTVQSTTSSSATLTWTAPGDDGNTGTATSYDLRYSTSPITAGNFSNATSAPTDSPQVAGSSESTVVQGLNCETTYYFALQTMDDAGNTSFSNIPSGSTTFCPTGDITVTITFDQAPTNASLAPATLRFNKDFAYSVTFDDSSPWEYDYSFPAMSGGTNVLGYQEPGYYYTDGCGNEIAYRGGIAINGGKLPELEDDGFYMSWLMVEEMYNADWDIFSHSYEHCAYGCDYVEQVVENTNIINQKLGFTVTHFCVPSGDEVGYRIPAFQNGMRGFHDQDYFLPGNGGLQVDGQMNLFQFELHRNTLETETPPYGEDIDNVANMSTNGNHYWFSEYIHRVGTPGEPWISVTIGDFRDYMGYIEDTYGRDGSDRVWVAPLQEVYEYIWIRDAIEETSTSLNGNELTVNYSLANIPQDLRRYALSLVVDSANGASVSNVEVTGANSCFSSEGLINLDW